MMMMLFAFQIIQKLPLRYFIFSSFFSLLAADAFS